MDGTAHDMSGKGMDVGVIVIVGVMVDVTVGIAVSVTGCSVEVGVAGEIALVRNWHPRLVARIKLIKICTIMDLCFIVHPFAIELTRLRNVFQFSC